MAYESERRVAVAAVSKACWLCRQVRVNLIREETLAKKDRSPVTVADFAAQAVVGYELRQAFPDDPLMAEEDALALRTESGAVVKEKVLQHVRAVIPALDEEAILSAIDASSYAGGGSGRFWALDPIDGTKGFLRGEQYAVALALLEAGRPVLGVLGCPNLPLDHHRPQELKGCLFIAVQGQGAWRRPLEEQEERPITVSGTSNPAEAVLCEPVESGHSRQQDSARIAARLGVTAAPYRLDSQSKYAVVARGEASVYLRLPTRADYAEKIWDHAAGWLLVSEAGGRVSDVHGRGLDFSLGRTLAHNKGVVATNGRLHEPVLAAVREVLNRL